MSHTIYQSADVDGVSVFYREAGPPDRPVILLLHGFPSSSRMWEPLLTRLADDFHLIAPDYPGFGHSDAPDPSGFAYTFDHLAEIIGRFTEQLGLGRYTLFMQDYGGPIGFRLATAHPARVRATIVQNAVAHDDGLGPLWDTRRAFWADRPAHEAALRETSSRPPPPGSATSAPVRSRSSTTRTCGPTSSRSSAGRASTTSRPTCSTTTAPTSPATRPGSNGCARTGRRCWWRGAATARPS
jgi:pimeloyl-ACP methyl ester carboxylesterase